MSTFNRLNQVYADSKLVSINNTHALLFSVTATAETLVGRMTLLKTRTFFCTRFHTITTTTSLILSWAMVMSSGKTGHL